MTPMLLQPDPKLKLWLRRVEPNKSKPGTNYQPEQKKEVSNMRKGVMALAASAVMAAMMVAGSAGTAFAMVGYTIPQ